MIYGTPSATFLSDAATAQYGLPTGFAVGRLVQATAGCAFTINNYDKMGCVAAQYQQIPTNCSSPYPYLDLYYGYDLLGNMTSSTNGEFQTFTYTYNGAARLTSLTSSQTGNGFPPNLLSNAHYNAFGAITSDTLGDGETESWVCNDHRGRLTSYTAVNGTTQVYSLNMTSYAPNSNVLAANGSVNRNWTHSYDQFNRAVGSNKNSGAAVYSYVYVQSDKTANFWIGDKAPGLGSNTQPVGGGLSGTTTQGYNQNFAVVQADPSKVDSGDLGGVFLNPDGSTTAGTIPGADIDEAAVHELLGPVWADLIGGESAGTQGNLKEALIAEDRVRNTDPSRGLKIRHQDSPQLIKTTDLPRITNPGSQP